MAEQRGAGSGFGPEVDRALAVLAGGGVLEGQLLEDLGFFLHDRFGSGTLGLVWDRIGRDRLEAHLDPTPALHQPSGIVHGGVWCAVVESMASVGAAMHVLGDGLVCVGAHNATDFLRPHREGRVLGVAEPVHVGRTQQLWQVVIRRASDDKVLARGQVRLANVDPHQLG
jgi:1,4-dihydroxy-2-naphthoyl-CoA hydrolase